MNVYYACCEHCDDVPPLDHEEALNRHEEPCPYACNDEDAS